MKLIVVQDQKGTWLETETGEIIAKFYNEDIAIIARDELNKYFNEADEMFAYFQKSGAV